MTFCPRYVAADTSVDPCETPIIRYQSNAPLPFLYLVTYVFLIFFLTLFPRCLCVRVSFSCRTFGSLQFCSSYPPLSSVVWPPPPPLSFGIFWYFPSPSPSSHALFSCNKIASHGIVAEVGENKGRTMGKTSRVILT